MPCIVRRLLFMTALLALPLAGCGEDPALPGNLPADHTVRRDGVAHKPGLGDPLTNCASCHGADLRGGESGEPSCYSCHGRTW